MKARVKEDNKLKHVRAFAGYLYNQQEWLAVPVGCEDEARRHPMMDIKEDDTEFSLNSLTVKELRQKAQVQGIAGHGLKKAELIAALEDE